MKTGLILLSMCFSVSVFSQTEVSLISTDSCNKEKMLPCKRSEEDIKNSTVKIDSITSFEFDSLIEKLYKKMSLSAQLSLQEDRTLVLLMNTLGWQDLDKQYDIEKRFPTLVSIAQLFETKYKAALKCKYSVCIGPGFSPYYRELGVQFLGNPFVCNRYLVRK